MDLEDRMCRQPLAWMWNQLVPGCAWISEANAGMGLYESGRPDGFVSPWMLPLECKADRGSLYTGNPTFPARKGPGWKEGDPQPEKRGFHTAQRDWLNRVCRKPGAYIPYQIAVWIHPAFSGRLDHRLSRLFIVNADRWLDMEYAAVSRFGTRSIPLDDSVTGFRYRRELNVMRWFAPFALEQYRRVTETSRTEIAWRVPASHPLWDDLRRHQLALIENLEFQRSQEIHDQ
jgi:hypothetical protein